MSLGNRDGIARHASEAVVGAAILHEQSTCEAENHPVGEKRMIQRLAVPGQWCE